jgi:heterodisulfide reductase subunit A
MPFAGKKLYDALVVGGGIAGIESALHLANNGLNVLLVEKDLTLGGKMIMLSKVFPTLDCSACITTPKISEAARHPNITILTIPR